MTETEIYYNPEQTNKKDFSVKKHELIHILIAWIGITFAFSWKGFANIQNMLIMLPIMFAGTITGFIMHELAHKFAAIKYGAQARFFLWPIGLGFAIVMSLITSGSFVFAAPGAVYIWGKNITKKENGIISIAGPFANFVFATLCIILGFVMSFINAHAYVVALFFIVAQINLFLGAFNLIPIPPLDGFKVFLWNKLIWLISIIAFIATYVIIFVLILK